MFRSFFLSWKWALPAYGGIISIFALLLFQVLTAWRFADWMLTVGGVVSGAEQFTTPEFIQKFMYEGVVIAGLFILIQSFLNVVSRVFCWFWYEAITFFYLPNWNKTLRDVSNPAERLQDSAEAFTLKFLEMSKAAVRASIVLVTGVPKLWIASKYFNFFSFGHIPGMLVWVVCFVCIVGFLISKLIGINLEKCRYDIRTARGFYRSGIEHVQRNKNRDDSIPNLEKLMKKMRKANFRLFFNQFWFEIWLGLYGQFWAVAPLIFFGYNVFSKHSTYGRAEQTRSTLGEVNGAASTPISLYDMYTDFLSTAARLKELEETINNPDNWEMERKENGWEDRRVGNNFVTDQSGKKIALSLDELSLLLEHIRRKEKE